MFDLHLIESGPEAKADVSQEDALNMCREMIRIREMELVLASLYEKKMVRGFCHLGIGQEAIPAGISQLLDPEDVLVTSYRCHGYALVSGIDPKEIICEQVGSSDGCSKGKGGSMHLFGKRFLGGHGIVGAQVPLGVGAAFAAKYKTLLNDARCFKGDAEGDAAGLWTKNAWKQNGCSSVVVCVFGDGAANQGQVYEAMNMAAIWRLPIVFICENNRYGMGTHIERVSASASVYDRFSFIAGVRIDSVDAAVVREGFRFAREHAIKQGPVILEVVSYRYNDHSMSDTFTGYRDAEEIEKHRKKDSIEEMKKYLGKEAEKIVQEMKKEAEVEMNTIKEIAMNSPRCTISDLYTDVLI